MKKKKIMFLMSSCLKKAVSPAKVLQVLSNGCSAVNPVILSKKAVGCGVLLNNHIFSLSAFCLPFLIFLISYFLLLLPSAFPWELLSETPHRKVTEGVQAWERKLTDGQGHEVTITGVEFSSKNSTLRVADFAPPEKSRLAALATARGALAGCNASYFHPDYRPLGLVVSDGKVVARQEKARLLSGILAVYPTSIELVRSGDYLARSDLQAAVQAGPWLVEAGKSIVGLDTSKRARRTLVAHDGGERWALIVLSPITLADAAALLVSPAAVPSWRISAALNLDGGSSTALWAKTSPPLSIPEFGYVRNFLLLYQK